MYLKPRTVNMDPIKQAIGGFGKYHLWICCLIFANKFGVAFHQMAIIYLAPPVFYTCPNLNDTCCEYPEYDRSIFKRTIIMEWHLICERAWLKDLAQTLFQLGVVTGSVFFGIISDRYGRRRTLIFVIIIEVFTGIMTSFLPDYWSFTIIRMILGCATGGIMVVGFVMCMEFVGNRNRDAISACYQMPFTIGHMCLPIFGYLLPDYMYFQLAISLSTTILLSYICLLPESPRWLLAMNKTVEAIALLENIAKVNNLPTEGIQNVIEMYQFEHRNVHNTKKLNVLYLFRVPSLRKNLLILSLTWFGCSCCFYGLSQYISYLTGNIHINVMASGAVCLIACFISIPIMRLLRRKTAVISANIACSLFLFITASIPEGHVSVVFGCLGVMCSFVIFVVIYLYTSELFPTVVRNAAVGMTSMVARVGAMVSPFIAGLRPYGRWCAPIVFGMFPILSAIACIWLPETKDCPLMTTLEEFEELSKKQTTEKAEKAENNRKSLNITG